MALFYTSTFRGTVADQNWAVNLHWRIASGEGDLTESKLCEAIADMCYDYWNTVVKVALTYRTVLTKIKVQAFDEPTGFYERPAAILGDYNKDLCPPFVAKGFRQFRSNQLFRTSTHRFPEVCEVNNVNGSFTFDTDVSNAKISAMAAFLTGARDVDVPDTILSINVVPVLIRTQYTTVTHDPETKTVTYLNPPEVSDVADAAFYGITSQVSRKYILPT